MSAGSNAPPARTGPRGDLVLVAAVVVAYLPALAAGFVWDDDHYVTANATLRALDGLRRIWFAPGATPQYYPLTFSTLWLDFHLWGLHPLGYHLVNVGLHAAAAVLLRHVLARLDVPGAWLAAALFALHPIAVESVAWVTERKNVLSAVCYLAAALVYLRFAGVPARDRWTGSWRAYAGAFALLLAALLAKSVTASLPAALALVLWWRRGRLTVADIVPLLPLAAVGVASGLGTAWLERHTVGAEGPQWALGLPARLLVAGRAPWFYLATLAWPHPLAFIYPRWTLDPRDPVSWAPLLAAVAALGALWAARRRLGCGPLVAALFFGGTLVPALGFFDVYPMRYAFVADHFAYLAAIGPLTLAAAGLATLDARRPAATRAAVALVLVALGVLTCVRTRAYRDAETLWRDTLATNPACWMCENNLGVLLYARGDVPGALARYRAAEALEPRAAEIHINLGNALDALGQPEAAIAAYRTALRLKPRSAGAHGNLGATLYRLGRIDEAIREYEAAIAIHPDYPDVHTNLGAALLSHGELAASAAASERALALRPDHPETLNNLGVALLHLGKPAEARARLEAAVRLRPTYAEAYSNLGNAHLALGGTDDAIAAYRQALGLRPGYVEAEYNLGHALALRGDVAGARTHLLEALRLDPDLEVARRDLTDLAASPEISDSSVP